MTDDDRFKNLNDREREALQFLEASGVELTPERISDALRFHRRAEEVRELSDRLRSVYPIRPDTTERARRWEAKDPNVVKYDDGDGDVYYKLVFTDDQRNAVVKRYLAARTPPADSHFHWRDEAAVFVGIIESWADSVDVFEAITPEAQKDRRRAMDSIANALMKFDQALSDLDSAALGFWYGNVVDALAVHGVQISEADNRLASMLREPFRATVEGGEMREQVRAIVDIAVEATRKAGENLPKFDHAENDWRLRRALAVERLILEHQIPFETTETGFAADVLRALFDLAGADVEKVSYWLKKAADHPDSHGRWLQSLRDRG